MHWRQFETAFKKSYPLETIHRQCHKLPEFTKISKQFYNDSTITAGHHSLCEIVKWYHNKMLVVKISDSLSNVLRKSKNQQTTDSLLIRNELSKVQQSSCDYLNIPFGISKSSFVLFLKKAGITFFTNDTSLLYYNNPEDPVYNTVAFYFDKNGNYYKYEIESVTSSLDSLDTYIRPFAGEISTLL